MADIGEAAGEDGELQRRTEVVGDEKTDMCGGEGEKKKKGRPPKKTAVKSEGAGADVMRSYLRSGKIEGLNKGIIRGKELNRTPEKRREEVGKEEGDSEEFKKRAERALEEGKKDVGAEGSSGTESARALKTTGGVEGIRETTEASGKEKKIEEKRDSGEKGGMSAIGEEWMECMRARLSEMDARLNEALEKLKVGERDAAIEEERNNRNSVKINELETVVAQLKESQERDRVRILELQLTLGELGEKEKMRERESATGVGNGEQDFGRGMLVNTNEQGESEEGRTVDDANVRRETEERGQRGEGGWRG